ncbi:hypothetical protein GCM10027269_50620 [Kribbella endophytica]
MEGVTTNTCRVKLPPATFCDRVLTGLTGGRRVVPEPPQDNETPGDLLKRRGTCRCERFQSGTR